MAKVLIVEDYPTILKLYSLAFTSAGHSVTEATTGQEALTCVNAQDFDLILLDILLPEFSGIDFLRAFNASEHPDTTIIITSNIDTPKLVKEAHNLGAYKYIVKAKYTPRDIVAMSEAALSKNR